MYLFHGNMSQQIKKKKSQTYEPTIYIKIYDVLEVSHNLIFG